VILLCDQGRNQGFLQGLNKSDGEVKWEQPRKGLDYCNATPILMDVAGKTQLIVAGSKALNGLNPASGDPIWFCKSWGFGSSPVYGKGLVYADRGGNEPAICVDPNGTGDVTKTHVKWQVDKVPGDYSSPVISGDYIYRVVAEGVIECRSLASGEKLFSGRLEGVSKLASPIATPDGRVYFASTGNSYVIKAGPTLEILASSKLPGGGNGSSAAISAGRIFVRDFDFLYCLGK
jgi:outer membrane protein assembly factor BamB